MASYSASSANAKASPQRAHKGKAVLATATPVDAVHLSETLMEEAPHVGREAEYEAVVSYVSRRCAQESNTALFVCGGCGCGKTSTIKRALRAMSSRVLPCDAKGGRSLVKRGTLAERGWASSVVTHSAAHSDEEKGRGLHANNSTCDSRSAIGSGSPTRLAKKEESAAADAKQLFASDPSTPRTSHLLGSEAAGLTPSPSLSCTLSSATTPAVTRRPSGLLADTPLLLSPSPVAARLSASSDDSTSSVLAAAMETGSPRGCYKRPRLHDEADDAEGETASTGDSRRVRSRRAAATARAAVTPYSLEYFQLRYPEVFADGGKITPAAAAVSSSRRGSSTRALFGHYVNCADVSGAALVEAICESIQATCTRSDAATRALLQQLSCLGGKAGLHSSSSGGSVVASKAASSTSPALHVVALDEVEYVRGGGAKTLAQLAELAFQLPGQLALIFISNQRAFVHVPQMMLEALLFEPYSEAQLRSIGADATAAELHRCEALASDGKRRAAPRSSAAAGSSSAAVCVKATEIDIKPRLFDYIARKALLEYSGDVRQVIAMCHRVVSVAWAEVAESKASSKTAGRGTKKAAAKAGSGAAASADLPTKLEAAVETFHAPSAQSSGRGAGSVPSSTRSSASAAATAPADEAVVAPPPSLSGVMTLAKSVKLLQSNQVESDIDRYVGTLPEQTLYVLSCIVVLTLRRQEERSYAMTSVGGRMGTARTPNAGVAAAQRAAPSLSLKLHEVHQLYTRLMAELHFPAMRADGFPLQVECLADFGVLTRPQLRGTDRIFSLNGTWTLQAMQQALVKRGEAIKQDRLAAGAEAVIENKFEEVLRELSRLVR